VRDSSGVTADSSFPVGTIDAHVHAGLDRYGPIERYVDVVVRLGLRGAVLVQHQGQFDNSYLEWAVGAFPGRFAGVGAVDVSRPSAADDLRRTVASGLAGIRVHTAALLDGTQSAQLLHAAEEVAAVVSVIGAPERIASTNFRRMVHRAPGIQFRLEHLAGLRYPAAPADPLTRAILELADEPNVSVMWSGFWLNAGTALPYSPAVEIVRASFDAFGPERICWSGDWNRPGPPDGRHISDDAYLAEARLLEGAFGVTDPEDRAAILGETAAELFGLGTAPAGS
jgi:L-fuconolactonase